MAALLPRGETDTAGVHPRFRRGSPPLPITWSRKSWNGSPQPCGALPNGASTGFNALRAAVTGQPESAERLAALERGNLLIVPPMINASGIAITTLFADALRGAFAR
ncbi:MAG: hypothetical protein IPK17_38955 [Chloroflexi bacterium]|uniref:hypothetical protein n=1 Tax=Candidatus Flexifilum breve TaxID=3140694 RepID=UPI0031366BD8|nr:hypothetical protein [Chloroflexota bacterium]